jgi:hypothetical protein
LITRKKREKQPIHSKRLKRLQEIVAWRVGDNLPLTEYLIIWVCFKMIYSWQWEVELREVWPGVDGFLLFK